MLVEALSIVIYTLNPTQVKKGDHSTPFELWYVYSPNVKYFKVFGRKFYILKDFKNGKLEDKRSRYIPSLLHKK